MNLVINARDAMPRGGALTISVANTRLDAEYVVTHADVVPGPYVMVSVTDTGTGIEEALRLRIFEPFFTATVFGIVKQSGGSVSVYSEAGVGTTFKVYLPVVEAAEPDKDVDTTAAARGGNETILLVEDEELVRRPIERLLTRRGYRVLSAASAAEAIELARPSGEWIHLMLTDVVMPGTSGPELARQVLLTRPDMRVLFMSGYPGEVVARQWEVRRGVPFIQKPPTTDALLRSVREAIDGLRPDLGRPEGKADGT